MKFARGHVTQPMKVVGQTDKTGTEVVFKPDPGDVHRDDGV